MLGGWPDLLVGCVELSARSWGQTQCAAWVRLLLLGPPPPLVGGGGALCVHWLVDIAVSV